MIARARARLPEATPLGALRLPLAVAMAILLALIVAGGSLGEEGTAALAGLAAVLVIVAAPAIDRRLLVPIVIVVLPLEIWEEVAPISFTGDGIVDRLGRSTLLNAGRVAIAALGLYWLLTARAGWERRLPRGRLVLPSFLLLAVFALGTLYSRDFGQGFVFTVTLVFHLALMMLVPVFVRDRATLRLSVWTLIAVMVALAFVGIYQQATGVFIWNPDLGFENTPRINTTFLDPNIYARMLVVAAVLVIPASSALPREWRVPTVLGALGPTLLALVFTNSRTGWVIAALALPLVLALMPMSRHMRLNAVGAAAGGAAFLLLVSEVVFDATFFTRLETLADGWDALGARRFLIEAAWNMFLDNPITGIGLGAFQDAYLGPYSRFNLDPESGVSLSHTEIMTVLAELGFIGALAFGFLFLRYAQSAISLFRATDGELRAIVAGLGVSVFVIFVSGQAESRLLGDPYLWLLFGLTLALEGVVRRERGLDPPDED